MKTKVGLAHEPGRDRPWLVRWWDPPDRDTGRQRRRYKAFKYKRDAVAFQGDKQAEVNSGEEQPARRDVTLGQHLSEFLKARVAGCSYGTQRAYEDTAAQLREFFGNARPLREVERRHAEAFMSGRARRDGRTGKLSSWTLAGYLKHCRAIFGAAVEWGFIARNPFTPPGRNGQSPLRVRAKSRPWQHITPGEFLQLLVAVPDVRRRAAYWLMYGCGLRPGEVYNLTIDRIDLSARRVHVGNRAASEELPPFTVKADDRSDEGKERSVPIPKAAIQDLTEAVRIAFKSGGFVALTPNRFAYIREAWGKCRAGERWGDNNAHRPWRNRDMLNNVLRNAKGHLRKAGIELTAPFTLSTFRKSFAQNHADNATPPRTLARLLGHSTVRVTMQFYNRVTDANEQAAAATVDRLLAADCHSIATGAPSEGVA